MGDPGEFTENGVVLDPNLAANLEQGGADAVGRRRPFSTASSHQVDPHDDWLDSREGTQYLGMHRDTLRRLAAARAIPAEQDGHGCKLHLRRDALDEWRRASGAARRRSAVVEAA